MQIGNPGGAPRNESSWKDRSVEGWKKYIKDSSEEMQGGVYGMARNFIEHIGDSKGYYTPYGHDQLQNKDSLIDALDIVLFNVKDLDEATKKEGQAYLELIKNE